MIISAHTDLERLRGDIGEVRTQQSRTQGITCAYVVLW